MGKGLGYTAIAGVGLIRSRLRTVIVQFSSSGVNCNSRVSNTSSELRGHLFLIRNNAQGHVAKYVAS